MIFKRKKKNTPEIDKSLLPKHVAIIMDGNGRWAKKRGVPKIVGHRAGAEALRRVSRFAGRVGIEYITVYAFSTENWNRPEGEVEALMGEYFEAVQYGQVDDLTAWAQQFMDEANALLLEGAQSVEE